MASRRRSSEQRLTLTQLRERAGLTQQDLARATGVSQMEISRAERREDHRVSTLRRYVEALGGTLEVSVSVGHETLRLRDV